jgi:tetratricopeptide (TPR) repeat protein
MVEIPKLPKCLPELYQSPLIAFVDGAIWGAHTLWNLATAFFDLRRFVDAARAYKEALQLNGENYIVWGNLGDAYQYSGDSAGASAAYQKAITLAQKRLEVNPRDATALGNLALYDSNLGHFKLARESLDRALRLIPNDADVLLDAALVYYNSGDVEQALHWLAKALQQGFSLDTVRNAPAFDGLHGDPRFKFLLDRYGSRHEGSSPTCFESGEGPPRCFRIAVAGKTSAPNLS